MNSTDATDAVDALIAARDNRSVMKHRLLSVYCGARGKFIFAFEGVDDKIAFARWINRIDPQRDYEPFVSNGKRNSRILSHVVSEDESGLRNRVAIFVDRDFDDLDGFSKYEFLYHTDRYSIENYIICNDLLNYILRDDFPLDGKPEIREDIISNFQRLYSKFLEVTRDANLRLFVASKEKISRPKDFNLRLSQIAQVSEEEVTPSETAIHESIPLEREPTDAEVTKWLDEFDKLDPHLRYRGKFAFQFLKRFLEDLTKSCKAGSGPIFKGVAYTPVRSVDFSNLSGLASRSAIPEGLAAFLSRLPN